MCYIHDSVPHGTTMHSSGRVPNSESESSRCQEPSTHDVTLKLRGSCSHCGPVHEESSGSRGWRTSRLCLPLTVLILHRLTGVVPQRVGQDSIGFRNVQSGCTVHFRRHSCPMKQHSATKGHQTSHRERVAGHVAEPLRLLLRRPCFGQSRAHRPKATSPCLVRIPCRKPSHA